MKIEIFHKRDINYSNSGYNANYPVFVSTKIFDYSIDPVELSTDSYFVRKTRKFKTVFPIDTYQHLLFLLSDTEQTTVINDTIYTNYVLKFFDNDNSLIYFGIIKLCSKTESFRDKKVNIECDDFTALISKTDIEIPVQSFTYIKYCNEDEEIDDYSYYNAYGRIRNIIVNGCSVNCLIVNFKAENIFKKNDSIRLYYGLGDGILKTIDYSDCEYDYNGSTYKADIVILNTINPPYALKYSNTIDVNSTIQWFEYIYYLAINSYWKDLPKIKDTYGIIKEFDENLFIESEITFDKTAIHTFNWTSFISGHINNKYDIIIDNGKIYMFCVTQEDVGTYTYKLKFRYETYQINSLVVLQSTTDIFDELTLSAGLTTEAVLDGNEFYIEGTILAGDPKSYVLNCMLLLPENHMNYLWEKLYFRKIIDIVYNRLKYGGTAYAMTFFSNESSSQYWIHNPDWIKPDPDHAGSVSLPTLSDPEASSKNKTLYATLTHGFDAVNIKRGRYNIREIVKTLLYLNDFTIYQKQDKLYLQPRTKVSNNSIAVTDIISVSIEPFIQGAVSSATLSMIAEQSNNITQISGFNLLDYLSNYYTQKFANLRYIIKARVKSETEINLHDTVETTNLTAGTEQVYNYFVQSVLKNGNIYDLKLSAITGGEGADNSPSVEYMKSSRPDWLVLTGYWNDNGIWDDISIWEDE